MLILLIIIFWLLHCYDVLIRTMISKIFSRKSRCSSLQWDLCVSFVRYVWLGHWWMWYGLNVTISLLAAPWMRMRFRYWLLWAARKMRHPKYLKRRRPLGVGEDGVGWVWRRLEWMETTKIGSECWRLLNASVSAQSSQSVAFLWVEEIWLMLKASRVEHSQPMLLT